MGTILHKVMESLANYKLRVQSGESSFSDDVVGTVSVEEKRLFDESLVYDFFVSSYNYYTDPKNSVHTYTNKDRDTIWTWCLNALAYNGGMFDPRRRTIVAAEPHFDIPIEEGWARYNYGDGLEGYLRIKGTIDLVTDVAPNQYEVVDYKSGECKDWGTGKEKDYVNFCVDPQLHLYYYALRTLYPDVRDIAMTMYYTRTAGPFTVAYSDENLRITLTMLRHRFGQIKNCVRPKLKSPTGAHWFCKRVCHYGKTDHPDRPGCTICQYVAEKTRRYGINTVIHEDTHEGHSLDYYHDPGS